LRRMQPILYNTTPCHDPPGGQVDMHKKIGEILLELGFIAEAEIKRILEIQRAEGGRRRFGEILLDGEMPEERILKALAVQFSMPVVEAKDFPEELRSVTVSFRLPSAIPPTRSASRRSGLPSGTRSRRRLRGGTRYSGTCSF
jgi:hypothetical protein